MGVKNRSPFAAVKKRSNILLDNLIVTFLGVVAAFRKTELPLSYFQFCIEIFLS